MKVKDFLRIIYFQQDAICVMCAMVRSATTDNLGSAAGFSPKGQPLTLAFVGLWGVLVSDNLPWFPFYIDKWETDPRVRAMGPVARSYFLILLIVQWREGKIPADLKTLRRLLVLPCDPVRRLPSFPPDFSQEDVERLIDQEAVLNQVVECFESDGNGGLRNDTLAGIRKHQTAIIDAKSRGGKNKGINKLPRVFKDTKKTPGVDLDLDLDLDKELKIKSFVRPTLTELILYCAERGGKVDPQAWLDHYTSNGWRVGKNPMKNWQSAVRQWERNGFQASTKKESVGERNKRALAEMERRSQQNNALVFPQP